MQVHQARHTTTAGLAFPAGLLHSPSSSQSHLVQAATRPLLAILPSRLPRLYLDLSPLLARFVTAQPGLAPRHLPKVV